MTRVLITGGCGFFGHHLVEHVLKNTDWEVVVLDRLSYSSRGFDRLRDIEAFDDRRVHVLTHDLTLPIVDGMAQEIGRVDVIVHAAAETHVDRSIEDARPFVMANVLGTLNILEFARTCDRLQQLVYFSTDEVFGPAPNGVRHKEWDRYNCTNPYAATKASGEELAMAFANTYSIPVLASHTMNMIGERQDPEKFVPLVVRKVLAGEVVTIHADPTCARAGSRFYIHCRNVADALLFLIARAPFDRGKINIVGEKEVDNLTLAQMIAGFVGKPLHYQMTDFHSSRPGHDLRYALDGDLLAAHGWHPPNTFEASLEKTVRWTLENPRWLERP